MPFTLTEILKATGGRLATGAADTSPTNEEELLAVETDSRRIAGPCLFWALAGDRFDGHDFVDAALRAGATACVVRDGFAISDRDAGRFVVVPDTLRALADLARWHLARCQVKVVGITGSYGKTTTREMVAAVLSQRYRVFQSQKNFNNDVGLPLCLFDLTPEHEVAVLEMGASAIGDIRRLCAIARPDYGIITGIGRAHSETFGGVLKTREAKSELVQCMSPSGRAFLPGDDPKHEFLKSKSAAPVTYVTTTLNSVATLGTEPCWHGEYIGLNHGRVSFSVDGHAFEFSAAGTHFVRNALFAYAVGRELGLTPDEIAAGLASFQPVSGRCQVLTIGKWTVIDDTYNASPEAMQAACRALGQWPTSGRRLLVTGDMLALGDDAMKGHQDVGRAAAEARVDVVLSLGANAPTLIDAARQAGLDTAATAAFSEIEPLLNRLEQELHTGDVILIKGSRGMRMERVVEWLEAARPNGLR